MADTIVSLPVLKQR